MNSVLSMAALLLALALGSEGQLRNRGFFDYGAAVGDSELTTDNSFSPAMNINFNFFGFAYSTLYVCDNGFLSPTNTYAHAGQFTVTNKRTVMSVYATEIHTHFGGHIYYRDTTNATILNRASRFVKVFLRGTGVRKPDFAATRAVIATWDDVQANGMVGSAKFQTAFVTDGPEVYIINHYGDLGFGDDQTVIGFGSLEYWAHYFVDRTGISTSTNANEPGRHVYRIDQQTIVA